MPIYKKIKALRGFPLVQDYKKLEESMRESSENFALLNEELEKNLIFQRLSMYIFEALIKPNIDLGTTTRQILTKIINTLNLQAGIVHLLNEEIDGLSLVASHSVSKDFLDTCRKFSIGEGIIGNAAQIQSEPMILSNNNINLFNYEKGEGLKKSDKMIIVPLKLKDDLIGILTLFTVEGQKVDKYAVDAMNTIAGHLAAGFKSNLLFEETKKQAIKDSLTDLHNREYFQEFLALELNRSQRYGKPLSLAIMDIDFFKKINDTYGHPVGDFVLKEFAQILKKSFRKTDLVARYGGEEFIAVFPEADTENTLRSVEKLQKKLSAHLFSTNGNKQKITVSMGISAFNPKNKITQKELILRADKALYDAKENGRNRVMIWNKPSDPVNCQN